jgi:hypothetical protein
VNDRQYRAMMQEIARRSGTVAASVPPNFREGAFAQQIKFLEDTSQFKIAHCSRGAAKSYTAGIGIFETMEAFPGSSSFYVTKTRDMARNIMWFTVLKEIDEKFKIGIEFNETLLEGRHPNGSRLRLMGIDADRKQQDKLLGGKYKRVILDEVAFFERDLTEIIYRTLIPAAGRVGGDIWLLSTSSDYLRGLFYEATQPDKTKRIKGWSVHEWDWFDNPYIREEMQKTIDKLIAANPLIVETNHYKQHYLNMWTVDESKLVYRFNAQKNIIDTVPRLPADGWSYVLGVDLGWEDDNAWVLTAYHQNDPHLYVLRTFSKKRMTFDQTAAMTQRMMLDPMTQQPLPCRIFIDGANKQGVESMRVRSSLPFEYADKMDKATFIELCNGDLVQAKIKVVDNQENQENQELCQEMQQLVWESDGDAIKFPKKEHPGLPNHKCDAFLYAWRMGYHFHSSPAEVKVPIGSPAWYKAQAENIWEKERERLIAETQSNDWPSEAEGWPSNF